MRESKNDQKKVLMVSSYIGKNTYVKNLVDALKSECFVATGIESFWCSNIPFDIVHIHYPEELFYWDSNYGEEGLHSLEKRIEYWKKLGSKIVVTIHDERAHRGKKDDKKLFKLIYENADGMIHLGRFSYENLGLSNGVSDVLPHHLYQDLIELKIDNPKSSPNKGETVFLSIGAIRKQAERSFLLNSFYLFRKNNKKSKLLICNFKLPSESIGFKSDPLRKIWYELAFRFKKFFFLWRNVYLLDHDISKEQMKGLVSQSDILITPRVDSLNSGIIFLALSLNKPVIGPSIGNMTEILDELGCPTYVPGDENTFVKALSFFLNEENVVTCAERYQRFVAICDVGVVAKKHVQFYESVINKKRIQ